MSVCSGVLKLAHCRVMPFLLRDIKAGNILVSSSKGIMLADLGSAATPDRKAGWVQARSTKKTFVGSPCWMAPEVGY
jgi:serine/threonine-protein kinase OSR1/STK39